MTTERPPEIEHDDQEFADKRAPWLLIFVVVAAGVGLNLYSHPFDWRSAGLGFIVGGVFVAWVCDITGGKVPASWRRRPPRS